MTSPVQAEAEREREEDKEREGSGRWHRSSESKRGETALDGLAAEQMWMREGEVGRERM